MNPAISRKVFFVFAASVALALPLSSAVQAREPELSFYPVGGWAVGEVPDKCSISTAFNNGFDMRFNGAGGQLKAMEVDFHQDIFKQGKAYDATLTLSGGREQKISALNTAPGVLSFNLEGSAGMRQELSSASTLDLAIEQNSFRFHLPGFSKAFGGFDRCIGGARAGLPAEDLKAGDRKKSATKKPVLSESMEMEQAVKEKSADVSAPQVFEVKEKVSSTKVETAPGEKPVAAPAGKAMVDPAPGLVNKDRVSPNQVSRLLSQQLDSEEVPSPVSGEPQPLLQDDAASAPPLPDAAPVVKKEAASTPEVVVHKSRIKAEADFTKEPETDSIGKVTDDRAGRELSELRKTVDSLRAENIALNNELKSMVRDSEQERLSITSENWNLEQATMKYNEAERQIKRLGLELQKERARCENDRKELEAMLFDPQLTNQQQLARLADLEAQLAKAKEENQLQRLRYEERIRALESVGNVAP